MGAKAQKDYITLDILKKISNYTVQQFRSYAQEEGFVECDMYDCTYSNCVCYIDKTMSVSFYRQLNSDGTVTFGFMNMYGDDYDDIFDEVEFSGDFQYVKKETNTQVEGTYTRYYYQNNSYYIIFYETSWIQGSGSLDIEITRK